MVCEQNLLRHETSQKMSTSSDRNPVFDVIEFLCRLYITRQRSEHQLVKNRKLPAAAININDIALAIYKSQWHCICHIHITMALHLQYMHPNDTLHLQYMHPNDLLDLQYINRNGFYNGNIQITIT